MSYTVKSSEKLRKSGAETETKALLYLMNFRSDSERSVSSFAKISFSFSGVSGGGRVSAPFM